MAEEWGPTKPHPLSQMKTELVWEGKYDEFGNRREVEVAGLDLPLQKVESIDEPYQAAQGGDQLELWERRNKREDDFRNMLVWGDNKLAMASMLSMFRDSVDFIYIDPPFNVGADFSMRVPVGEGKATVEKDQSILEAVAYSDTWGKGTDSYLQVMYERLVLMRSLLGERGTIAVHCDWHVGHLLRAVLDEVFGSDRFLNEIVWYYKRWTTRVSVLPRLHDLILWYSKGDAYTFNQPMTPNTDPNPSQYVSAKDENGKTVVLRDEQGHAVMREIRDEIPTSDAWDIPLMSPVSKERLGYATQKPERLLDRLVAMATDPGDLVADFFCGSGTTGAVAEKMERRWIMADLGRFSVHTSRKRMIDLQRQLYGEGKPYRAFDVYNLGRYERQWWQKERLKGATAVRLFDCRRRVTNVSSMGCVTR